MILKYKISTISYYREMAYQFCAVAHMINNCISPPHNDARNNCTSVNRKIHYSKVYAKSTCFTLLHFHSIYAPPSKNGLPSKQLLKIYKTK